MAKMWAGMAASLVLAAPAYAGERLVNGNFEAPGTAGSVAPGWVIETTTSPLAVQAVKGSAYVVCCGAGGSPGAVANTFVTFGSGNIQTTNTDRIFQDYFAAAGTQTLSFDWAAFGAQGQAVSFGIFDYTLNTFAFVSLNNPSRAPDNNLDTTFGRYTFQFQGASSGLYNVQFTSFSNTVNADGLLDNVSLVASVPEPSAWALLIAGFGVVGAALRRSRNRRVALSFA